MSENETLEFEQDENILLTDDELLLANGLYDAFNAEIVHFIPVTEKRTNRRRCMVVVISESEDDEEDKMIPIGILFDNDDNPFNDYDFPFIVENIALGIDTSPVPTTKEVGFFSRMLQKLTG